MTREKAGALLSESMKTVYLWSLAKLGDAWEAEDLCSDVLTAVLEGASRLRHDDAFFGYLWQTAYRTYRAFLRKKAKREKILTEGELAAQRPGDERDGDGRGRRALENFPDPDAANPGELLALREEEAGTGRALRRELALLSENYRRCTVAFYFDRLTYREIAEKYRLSADMVKYYLLRSKQILKEGIAMEREFGEKSYRPANFKLGCFYNGRDSYYHGALFDRILPGQILLSAYYAPMTAEQLSVELGVASVYLEDELRLLLEAELLSQTGKKYRTTIPILTEDYVNALHELLRREYRDRVVPIIGGLREKLPRLREIGFEGHDLPENLLLWDFFAYLILRGNSERFASLGGPAFREDKEKVGRIYYGWSCSLEAKKWAGINYAGMSTDDQGNRCSFVDFSYEGENFRSKIPISEWKKHLPIFQDAELEKVREILRDEHSMMNDLIWAVCERAAALFADYTPEDLKASAKAVIDRISPISFCGFYGEAAVETGALARPRDDEFAGYIGYRKED